MNQPPTLPDPPFGTDTDEALSALLDGELGAFAAEHGITEAAARDRLESWPGLAARRAALEQARAAVGAPTPPLDDLTRRRIVRAATAELPGSAVAPARSRPWARIVAAAAAGLLVVAGIGFAISATGGDEGSMSSTAGGSGARPGEPLRGDVGDLGDVTSADALRSLLDRRETAAGSSAGSSAEDTTKRSEQTTADAAPEAQPDGPSEDGADSSGAATAGSLSPDACARQLAGDREVTFTGTGTYRGTPVTIVGITERGRTIVFVVPSNDCVNVLTSISR